MKPEVKKFLLDRAKFYVPVLSLGIGYFIWLKLTNLGIPCSFRLLTGFKCPGCGLTTMIMNSSHGDFKGAFESNSYIFCVAPILIVVFFLNEFLSFHKHYMTSESFEIKYGKLNSINKVVAVLLLAGFIIFGVVRNLI